MDNLKELLSSFDSIVLVKIPKKNDDVLASNFVYEVGDFTHEGNHKIHNFNDVLKSINRKAPICEGIGYYEYINEIKEAIKYCLSNQKRCSFIIPFVHEKKNHYYLMNISSYEEELCALFLYMDDKNSLYNFEEATKGTFKDNLTGLFNYRTLVSHISDNKRRGYLSFFDLNKFKEINDHHGHEMGDEVIKSVAKYLISIASMNEVFYRRSGDEFMILVFEHDLDYVLNLINKIESHIESIPSLLNKDFECSAAFGVLEVNENNLKGNYELQSKLTDLAMYQAKASHKLYHYISQEDATNIISSGDLDKRIKQAANKIKR